MLDNDLLNHFFGQQRHQQEKYDKLIAKFVKPPVLVPEIVTDEMRSSVMSLIKSKMFESTAVENENTEFSEQVKGIKCINDPSTPHYAQALYRLLKGDDLPYNVLVAYLLLQAHLLESRKKSMTQLSTIKAEADQLDNELLTQLTFSKEGITLLLRRDFYSEMKTVNDFFSLNNVSAETLNDLSKLSETFFQAVEQTFPLPLHEVQCSSEIAKKLEKLQKETVCLLSVSPMQMSSFLLICQCSQDLGNLEYLDNLIPVLFDLIQKANSVQSVIIIRQFLQLVERCHPRDGLFQNRQEIEELMVLFGTPNVPKEMLTFKLCAVLAFSHITEISAFISEKLTEQPLEIYIDLTKKMIDQYLKLTPPALSLALAVVDRSAIHLAAENLDLFTYIEPIFASLKKTPQLQFLTRVAKTSHLLISSEKSKWSANKTAAYSEFFDLLQDKDFHVVVHELILSAEKTGMKYVRGNELTLKLLLRQFQDKKITHTNLALAWNKSIEQQSREDIDEKINLNLLMEIALILLSQPIANKDIFSKNLFWLIGSLLTGEQKATAISFYELGCKKKLFEGIQKFDAHVWFKIFHHYFFSDKKSKENQALPLSEKLLATSVANDVVKVLLDQGSLDNKTAILILKALTASSLLDQKVKAVQALILYINFPKDPKKLPVDFQKILKANLSKTLSIFKELILENSNIAIGDVPVSTFLSQLLQILPKLEVDLATTINSNSLWNIFLLSFNALEKSENTFKPIFEHLLKSKKTTREPSKGRDEFYLKLLDYYLAEKSFKAIDCVERLLYYTQKDKKFSTLELNQLTKCMSLLIQNEKFEESKSLLNFIEKEKIVFLKDWLNEAWKNLLFASLKQDSVFSIELLLEGYSLFGAESLQPHIQPLAASLAEVQIQSKDPSEVAEGIRIAILYQISNATFWIKVFKDNLAGTDSLIKIITQVETFTGVEADCQACWELLIPKLPKNNGALYQALLTKYTKILPLYNKNIAKKAAVAEKLIQGFLSLTYDTTVDNSKMQLLLEAIHELRDVCRAIQPGLKFFQLELDIIDRQFSFKSLKSFETAVSSLEMWAFDENCPKEKLFILINKSFQLFTALNLNKECTSYKSLHKIIKSYLQSLDVMEVLKFLIKNVGDLEILTDLLKGNSYACFTQDQKNNVQLLLEPMIKKIMLEDVAKFKELLTRMHQHKLMNSKIIGNWIIADFNAKLDALQKKIALKTPLIAKSEVLPLLKECIKEGINFTDSINYSLFISNLAKAFYYLITDKNVNWDKTLDEENVDSIGHQEVLNLLSEVYNGFFKKMSPIPLNHFFNGISEVTYGWEKINTFSNLDTRLLKLTSEYLATFTEKLNQNSATELPPSNLSAVDYVKDSGDWKNFQGFISEFTQLLCAHIPLNNSQQCAVFALNYFNLKLLLTIFPANPENGIYLTTFAKTKMQSELSVFYFHEHIAKCLFKDHVHHFKGVSYVLKNYHELSLLINSKFGDENDILTTQIPRAKIASEIAYYFFYNSSNPYQVFKGLEILSNCKSEFIDQQNFLVDNCNRIMIFICKLIIEKNHVHSNFLWKNLGENLRQISNTYYDIKNQKIHHLLGDYAIKTILVLPHISGNVLQGDVQIVKEEASFNFANEAYTLLYSQLVFLITRPEFNIKYFFEVMTSIIGLVDQNKIYQKSYLSLIKFTFGAQAESFIKNIFDRKGEAIQLKNVSDDKCEENMQKIISKFMQKSPTFNLTFSEDYFPQYNEFFQFLIDIYGSKPLICYEICMGAYWEFNEHLKGLPQTFKPKFQMTQIDILKMIMPFAVQANANERMDFSKILTKFFLNYQVANGIIAAIQAWERNLTNVGLQDELIVIINSDLIKVLFNTPGYMQIMLEFYMNSMISNTDNMFLLMPSSKFERDLQQVNIILYLNLTSYFKKLEELPLWIWFGEILTQEEILSKEVKEKIFVTLDKYFTLLIDNAEIFDNRINKKQIFENLLKILSKFQILPCYNDSLIRIIDLYAQLIPLIQNEIECDAFLLQINDLYNLKNSKFSRMCHSTDDNIIFDIIDCYSKIIMGVDMQMLTRNIVIDFKKYNMFKEVMLRSPTRIFHMYEIFKNQMVLNQFEPQFNQFMIPDFDSSIAKFNSMKITSDSSKDTFIKWCGEEIFMVHSSYNYTEGFVININNSLVNYFDLVLQNYKGAKLAKRKEMHAFLSKILNNILTTISIERKLLNLLINKLKLLS